MLTIQTENNKPLSQKIYDDIVSALDLYTLTCPCGMTGNFIWYGGYERNVALPCEVIRLRVARVYCNSCRHTHAVMLSSIVPYSRFSIEIQAEIIQSQEEHSDFKRVLEKHYTLSMENIRSIIKTYFRHWKERLLSMGAVLYPLTELIRLCFLYHRRQFMQIKSTRNKLIPAPT